MQIREYLFRNRMELQELSKRCCVNNRTMSALKSNTSKPSFRTATRIVNATSHHVGYSDLMPEMYDAMIREYLLKRGNSNGKN